jgi:hypothetical protein
MKRRHSIVIAALVFGSMTAYSQATDNVGIKDSLQVAMEREQLSTSLMQLRDSIVQSVQLLEARKPGMVSKAKRPVDKALKDLHASQKRVQKDLDELVAASKKGWNTDVATRLRASLNNVRREHNRIRQDLQAVLTSQS